MFLPLILSLLALQLVAGAELAGKKSPIEGKSFGGYGYGEGNSYGGYGNSHNSGYGNGYGSRGYSGNHGGQHNNRKQVPIQIPYIDRNGCSYPGDVVCNPADTDSTTYGYCVLADESKNLWKKPSMTLVVATCAPTGAVVLSDWCNDNERLLRAVGFIKDKENYQAYHHQRKYAVSLNPCILAA